MHVLIGSECRDSGIDAKSELLSVKIGNVSLLFGPSNQIFPRTVICVALVK